MTPIKFDPCIDPRPDLREDHALWARLLPAAYLIDGNKVGAQSSLFWSLEGMRCQGAQLVQTGDKVKLERGEIERIIWEGEDGKGGWRARWLVPHKDELTRLLKELAQAVKESAA